MNGTAVLVLVMHMMWPAVLSATTTPGPPFQCTLVELHSCLQSLQAHSNDLAFAATRRELLALCSTLQGSVGCVDLHMRHCFSPTQRKVFNHVVGGARQVLAELCVPGPIQEAYLVHAPCFKGVSLSEQKCAPAYRHLMATSENVNSRQNVDEGLRESCCAFDAFVSCKHLHVSQDCGPEAADFLQRHLDRISSPLIHEHCATYTHAADACTHTATASHATATLGNATGKAIMLITIVAAAAAFRMT